MKLGFLKLMRNNVKKKVKVKKDNFKDE